MYGRAVGGNASRIASAMMAGPFRDFVKYGSNPICVPENPWEAGNCQEDPKLIKVGSNYYMFSSCTDGSGVMGIGVRNCSEAEYPYVWHDYGNRILSPTGSSFESILVTAGTVIAMPDMTFRMYYHSSGAMGGVTASRMCLATCSAVEFPHTWHRYAGSPILDVTAGAFDDTFINDAVIVPSWLVSDGLWHAIYGGGKSDGITWRGGHAYSVDGLAWTKDPRNPILGPGATGGFDSVGVHPVGQAVKIGSLIYVPYQGYNGSTWETGVMATEDFVCFARSPLNAILRRGATGQWDFGSVENPGVMYLPSMGTLDLFYVSSSINPPQNDYRIGTARTTFTPM